MSRFPDFMRIDLTKLTFSGCFLVLFSFVLAFGAAIGVGFLVVQLFPGLANQGRPGRGIMVMALVAGFAVGAGFFQLGRLAMRHMGLRMYRQGYAPPGDPD